MLIYKLTTRRKLFLGFLGALFLGSDPLMAQSTKTTSITTYVTTVQEERQSTRFTLTEWLRIKERMKLMDVYLAMFSSPKTDEFAPELHLSYLVSRGAMSLETAGGQEEAAMAGSEARAQFWLTNLVTSTVGVRMLNIDFGLEVYQRASGAFVPEPQSSTELNAGVAAITASPNMATSRRALTQYGAANFRIFGKSIQDSVVVAKIGRYEHTNSLPLLPSDSASAGEASGEADAVTYDARLWRGVMTGLDMQLYFWKWFGAEGSYYSYGSASPGKASDAFSGTSYLYGPFVEISLLRFSVGRYAEHWKFLDRDGAPARVTEEGLMAGARLNF